MLEPAILEKIISYAKPRYDHGDPSHDFEHVIRVVKTCERFGSELGARLNLLVPAAYLHDVVYVPKNSPDRERASAVSSDEAMRFLPQLGFSASEIEQIGQIIVEHSYSRAIKASCLESAILQDADKLDGIGAIGVARVFACGTKMGSSFYESKNPWGNARLHDDKRFMLDHFFTKLLKLPALMNTEPGKKEAAIRIAFMEEFLAHFKREIS